MCNKNMQSENINELVKALSKAQGSVLKAKEENLNPFFKSKYADLTSIWDACRDALFKNGFAVIQTLNKIEEKTVLITTLAHESGQWIRSFSPIPNVKPDPQSVGSAITYMRRYSLAAIVGVSTHDDDGEAATKSYREKQNKESADKNKIKLLEKFLEKDLDLKKRIEKHMQKEGFQELEEFPIKVIDNTLKVARDRVKENVVEHIKVNQG